jgi:hypothetical protein
MFQDQLLQPQEGPLVRDLLPDLHRRLPRVLRRELGARRALACVHDKDEHESLLEDRIRQDLLLDRNFDLDSAGVGFCPDEGGVDKADLLEGTGDFLQTES